MQTNRQKLYRQTFTNTIKQYAIETDRQTKIYSDRQTIKTFFCKQTDKQTNEQISMQIDKQTIIQTDNKNFYVRRTNIYTDRRRTFIQTD